jgi:ceramide glucosyltransferase
MLAAGHWMLGGLAVLAFLSLGLTLWQLFAAARFPLHRRTAVPATPPAVTLLKPLKGADAETETCLRSWLEQDYPAPVRALFGVASENDPACPLVRKLIAERPERDARLVVCPERLGPNSKVSKLAQLERLAETDLLVVSDADVRVPPDLLSQLAAGLQDPGVRLVNCPYHMASPTSLAMRLEAFAVNADFWSQVLMARMLHPMDFAIGAVMAVRRDSLNRVGGFAALVDYIADDYQLGHRIARSGGGVLLSPVVVECRSAPETAGEVWRRELRWARTIRGSRPVSYFFSILSNGTLWPLLWALAQPAGMVLAAAGACLATRMCVAWWLEWRINRAPDFNSLWLAPTKDLLHVILWASAFAGNQVVWRGERLRILARGKLERV